MATDAILDSPPSSVPGKILVDIFNVVPWIRVVRVGAKNNQILSHFLHSTAKDAILDSPPSQAKYWWMRVV